ncbi:MAG TPA: VapC toxin family PIN domain ribonuclease [Verrucomicrobiales bacterium]|nr:VapC toxin family PIN domain ribonuclease [Verrucomicrobiales bacterium]
MNPGSLALDTTAVVLHLRQRSVVVSQKLGAAHELYLPVTALGELWYGVEHSDNPARSREPLEEFLQEAIIIYPDDETAKTYARLKEHLSKAGTPIPENDLWIAATARSHQLKLYHNDAHFMCLDGQIEHEHA